MRLTPAGPADTESTLETDVLGLEHVGVGRVDSRRDGLSFTREHRAVQLEVGRDFHEAQVGREFVAERDADLLISKAFLL